MAWDLTLETSAWLELTHSPGRRSDPGMGWRSSGAAIGNRRKARAKLLGELGHQNMTLTNNHSQNNEMVRNLGYNSVKADGPKRAEEA